MKQAAETGILLTDEELIAIHRGVMDNFPSRPEVIARSILVDVLPEPIKRALIPENKDLFTALPDLGRQLAIALVVDDGDMISQEEERLARETIAYSFARQITRIARQQLGIKPPERRRWATHNPVSDKLETKGQILAAVFSSPHFTPALGRHTLRVMAPEIDELVHPGLLSEFRMAIEALRQQFDSDQES